MIGVSADYYQLMNDYGEPIIYDPTCFTVVDSHEPEFWRFEYGTEGERYAHPPGWNVAGFFERWHDRDEIIRKVFAEQLDHWFPVTAQRTDYRSRVQ